MKTVIEMAREAGGMFDHMMWLNRDLLPVFERLVELARADERGRRTWVGLTEQERESLWYQSEAGGAILMRFAEAIEAKLKEKNT
jgi:hypothetical protein